MIIFDILCHPITLYSSAAKSDLRAIYLLRQKTFNHVVYRSLVSLPLRELGIRYLDCQLDSSSIRLEGGESETVALAGVNSSWFRA